ncbi:MAG: hypothetical protein ABIY70_08985 [Capsulimonas sp.]|uniref:hypothetical protein n=1 Tax=Capsulimonas sp. TaxID=2494211 RepID=UPI0032631CE2
MAIIRGKFKRTLAPWEQQRQEWGIDRDFYSLVHKAIWDIARGGAEFKSDIYAPSYDFLVNKGLLEHFERDISEDITWQFVHLSDTGIQIANRIFPSKNFHKFIPQ